MSVSPVHPNSRLSNRNLRAKCTLRLNETFYICTGITVGGERVPLFIIGDVCAQFFSDGCVELGPYAVLAAVP